MTQIYDMFRGTRSPEQVLAAAGQAPDGRFYAQLYVGLYHEAVGNAPLALRHLRLAASPDFREAGGYMHLVARVHLDRLSP